MSDSDMSDNERRDVGGSWISPAAKNAHSQGHPLSCDTNCRRRAAWAVSTLLVLLACGFRSDAQQTPAAEAADNFAGAQTTAALKNLSARSQKVIERLSKLNSLPLTEWRWHIGDMAHGESTGLNDSSWPSIKTPYETSTTETIWLRTWIEVPNAVSGYDLSGARIWTRPAKDSAVTVYLNGQRVASGEDLEPIILFDKAKAGERALLAIRIEHSEDRQTLPEATLRIEAAPDRPSPEALYTEFVSAALLIAELRMDVQGNQATLERAIGDVDLAALDGNEQARFDHSLRQAENDLQPIEPTLRAATFHLTGNAHIDAAWLWPWTETVDVVRRTFGTVLQLMEEYPAFTYTQSASQYNEWIADKYPEMHAQIKRRVQEGRWELVGGMWVEPDLNMPGGESLVRQLLIGQTTLQQLYGVRARVGWNPDSFGYNAQLPQIYKKSGMDYFVTQKMAWNETNPLPLKLFWWEAPDGSKVLTYFPHSYGNENLNPIRLANDFVNARSHAPGLLTMMDLYGVGDHGGGPTRAMLDEGAYWSAPGSVLPRMQFGTAQSFFSGIEKKIGPVSPIWNYEVMADKKPDLPAPPEGEVSIPTWRDELYFEHHRGTYTTQARQKRNMRESEVWMLNTETYSSLAWLGGEPYPTAVLNEAWKKVLFNQFHDLAAGSGIAAIYLDAQRDYDQVRRVTDAASARALQSIQARIDTHAAGSIPVLVFNTLGWQRSGLVEFSVQLAEHASNGFSVLDAKNHVVPSEVLSSDRQTNTYHLLVHAADIPPVGYAVLHVVPGKRAFSSDLKVSGFTMENDRLKVVVDANSGCITSLYEKKSRFESLAVGACANQLEVFQDKPSGDDAWNIDPGTLDHFTRLEQTDSVQVVENGPLRAVIRVSRTWQSSKFVQDITLYSDADQVEVVNDVDWHETHVLLKAAFPLAATSRKATYEIPFGTIERPTTRDNNWERAKFEVPALRWADLGDQQHGFSLINDSKYGYDCQDNVLRISLLRSPVSPDRLADRGHHKFRYTLYPHSGDWKTAFTIRHGYEFNDQLWATQVNPHAGSLPLVHSFLESSASNVVLTALKKAEDTDGLILRLYEWAGDSKNVEIKIPVGAKSANVTNLMEEPVGEPLPISSRDKVTVPVHAYEIVTIRVDYPHEPNATPSIIR
jgi:alpha-mannosidase